jgi:hypothetical protein
MNPLQVEVPLLVAICTWEGPSCALRYNSVRPIFRASASSSMVNHFVRPIENRCSRSCLHHEPIRTSSTRRNACQTKNSALISQPGLRWYGVRSPSRITPFLSDVAGRNAFRRVPGSYGGQGPGGTGPCRIRVASQSRSPAELGGGEAGELTAGLIVVQIAVAIAHDYNV